MFGCKRRSFKHHYTQYKKKFRKHRKTKCKNQKGIGEAHSKQQRISDLDHTVDALKFIMEQNIPEKQLSNAVFLGNTEGRQREYDENFSMRLRRARRLRTLFENPVKCKVIRKKKSQTRNKKK